MRCHYTESCCLLAAVDHDDQKFVCTLHIHPTDVEKLHLTHRQSWILLRGIPKADSPPEVQREKQGTLIFLPNPDSSRFMRSPLVRLGNNGWAHWRQTVSRGLVQAFAEAAISEGALSRELISETANLEGIQSISTSNLRVEQIDDAAALVICPKECLVLDRSWIY